MDEIITTSTIVNAVLDGGHYSESYKAGVAAAVENLANDESISNPYDLGTVEHDAFMRGLQRGINDYSKHKDYHLTRLSNPESLDRLTNTL